MADRIKNYQQEADQITTLKAIRTDLGVTPSSYTPDATVVTKDRVVTFAQAEEELVVLSDIEKGVKQQVVKGDIADKRISNIEKLLQGNLYDYQTDSTSAYTKSVPAGAMPYAGIEQIGGKTVVWNQLVDTGTTTVSTISGHKYYTLIDGTASIVTADGTAISVVDDTADMVCDLTLMFGSGNEPSISADFTAIFGATHYSYNAGTLLSAGVTDVVSNGANLIPTYTTSGSENGLTWTVSEDGSITINGTATYGTAILAPISSWQWDGRTPCWLSGCPNGGSTNSYFLDIYGEDEWGSYQLSNEDTGNGVALQSKLSWDISNKPLRFRIVIISGTQCNNLTFRPMLNYGTSAKPYAPYVGTIATYPIPASIQALEGYGWSAGTAYNYVDFERKKFVQNVDRVDLGSLNWVRSVTNDNARITSESVNNMKAVSSNTVVGNIICANFYTTYFENVFYGTASDNSFSITTSSNFGVKADNYTDATTFKTAMNGVYAYYELATPIETDISAYLTDDNLIQVESGGALTFPNSNGDDYRIPVPSEETYMIDLQEAINNG